jgi:hypothetical protein
MIVIGHSLLILPLGRASTDDGAVTEDEVVEAVRALVSADVDRVAPASPSSVSTAEAVIETRLPSLLRRLYLEVANGGFGPSGGVLGVDELGPLVSGAAVSIVEAYQRFRSLPDFPPPVGMVPLLDWGCALWSLVDCRGPVARMWGWDYDSDPTAPLFPDQLTLAEWFEAWLNSALEWPLSPAGGPSGFRWGPHGEVHSPR